MPERGEICLADLGETIGHEQAFRRHFVVASADRWLNSSPPVIAVVPVTRTFRDSVTHVEIEPGSSGLRAISYAKCEDIRSIPPNRLIKRFGHIDPVAIVQVEFILRNLLGL